MTVPLSLPGVPEPAAGRTAPAGPVGKDDPADPTVPVDGFAAVLAAALTLPMTVPVAPLAPADTKPASGTAGVSATAPVGAPAALAMAAPAAAALQGAVPVAAAPVLPAPAAPAPATTTALPTPVPAPLATAAGPVLAAPVAAAPAATAPAPTVPPQPGPTSPHAAAAGPAPTAAVVEETDAPVRRTAVEAAVQEVPRQAAAPAAPELPVSTRHVAPAVVDAARHLRHEGDRASLVVRLDPPELGAVLVRLTVQDGRVDVSLRTPDLAASGDLQARSWDVQQVLRDAGLDLGAFDVSHGDLAAGGQDRGRQTPPDRATPGVRGTADGPQSVTEDVTRPQAPGTWL